MIKTTETEQKIRNAAKEIFIEKGKDGARMKLIAEKAGVNKALLHYYFRSKETLYLEIIKDSLKEISRVIVEIPEDTPFKTFLQILIDKHISFLDSNKHILRFLIWELRNEEKIKNILLDIIKEDKPNILKLIRRRYENAIQKNEIKPIDYFHFLLNLVSLDVFPFLTEPIIKAVHNLSDEQYAEILSQRKKEVFNLIWSSIKAK